MKNYTLKNDNVSPSIDDERNHDGVKWSDINRGKREFINSLIAKGKVKTAETKEHTQEQKDIFAWCAGTLLATFRFLIVVARAGVGKTYTIMVAMLEHCTEVKQGLSCLYVVFNKRNQLEAEKKIVHKCITVKTWHSLGYSFIASHWGRIRGNDSIEWRRVESALGSKAKDCPKQVTFQIVSLIGHLKNYVGIPTTEFATKVAQTKDCTPTDKQEQAGFDIAFIVETAIAAMKLALTRERSGEISFGDMGGWLALELGCIPKGKFRFIAVDEGQDLNQVQFAVLTALCDDKTRACIVGDDRQAIYTWRGAMLNSLSIMGKALGATTLKLSKTFRCGKAIVKEANGIVPDYYAHDGNGEGRIESATYDAMIKDAKIGDAILSRVNAPLMSLCLQFIRQNKTAKIEGRDIGKMLVTLINNLDANNENFADKLNVWEQTRIAKATGWNATKTIELVQDQAETLRVVWESCDTIAAMVAKIESLFQDSASDYAKPAIVLSSVHKAKGLEWNRVYCLAETFNRARPGTTEEQATEELNIKYVAITRARDCLVWVNGGKVAPTPTPAKSNDASGQANGQGGDSSGESQTLEIESQQS